MVTAESRRGRRVIGTLDRGTDLFAGLRAACARYRVRSGELRAVGTLEQIELCAFDQQRRQWRPARTLSGGLELLSLIGSISEQQGNLSVTARATLMRERDAGIELLGGHVLGARVFSVEFVIETFDDLLLRRMHDPALGMAVWSEAIGESAGSAMAEPEPESELEAEPEPEPEPSAPVRGLPARNDAPKIAVPPAPGLPVPQASRDPFALEAPRRAVAVLDDRELHDVRLAAGDVIIHPKFRRCVVQRIEGDNEFVQVQLRNGRIVRLSLDILHLRPQGTENGQRVFEAEIDD